MKKHYPWLWFDADGTLFDYDRAECTALRLAFQSLDIPYADEFLDIYRGINQKLWQALERSEITPALLPVRRFEQLREALHLDYSPSQMSAAYLEYLALQTDLIDGAQDVLHALQATCRIAVVTNGLKVVQRNRMAHSAIREYISGLIISEEVGAAKPEPAFFEAAFARLGHPAKSDVLLIGDSLSSDIQGGVDYGLDTCWYNSEAEPRPADLPVTYEIKHLPELLEIIS
jgi:YjjG family noncanonical pyrimidine nucleotidase